MPPDHTYVPSKGIWSLRDRLGVAAWLWAPTRRHFLLWFLEMRSCPRADVAARGSWGDTHVTGGCKVLRGPGVGGLKEGSATASWVGSSPHPAPEAETQVVALLFPPLRGLPSLTQLSWVMGGQRGPLFLTQQAEAELWVGSEPGLALLWGGGPQVWTLHLGPCCIQALTVPADHSVQGPLTSQWVPTSPGSPLGLHTAWLSCSGLVSRTRCSCWLGPSVGPLWMRHILV